MLDNICSHNGKIRSKEDVGISPDNLAATYGFGVYENIKVRSKKIYYLQDHLERLIASAAAIELPLTHTLDELTHHVLELADAITHESYNIKVLVIGENTYIFALAPIFIAKKIARDGVAVITIPGKRFLPQAKTLNMLPSYLAYREAKKQGAYDALFTEEGVVVEGTRTNVFFTDGNQVITAPSEDVLEGVTRTHVLHILEEQNIPVVFKKVHVQEIEKYSCFLTSTSIGIIPVHTCNGETIPPSQLIAKLQQLYKEHSEHSTTRRE